MLKCNDVPNKVEGTRAPPVNGVANGGKMDTKERRRGLSGSISRAGKGCAASRALTRPGEIS